MIENSHAWLRNGLSMYYNINDTPEGMFCRLRKYTPDFLIRNWQTGKAELIEIKPDHYDDRVALRKRETIANQYISEMSYDWKYRLVRESDIRLSDDAHLRFQKLITKNTAAGFFSGDLLQNNSGYSDECYSRYVRTGVFPARVH